MYALEVNLTRWLLIEHHKFHHLEMDQWLSSEPMSLSSGMAGGP